MVNLTEAEHKYTYQSGNEIDLNQYKIMETNIISYTRLSIDSKVKDLFLLLSSLPPDELTQEDINLLNDLQMHPSISKMMIII